ncbi:putative protein c21orf59 [Toxoplasma gondii TgCatPRC2]|uniref:Cilia- and flagella-associated protein 298 n=2 Tax=Toxoplasma gondii TaxID=5811 RepID=A0A151HNX2_TOXGO|nr:putative protein c21orf59 [Toxoplasma gondii ARI]KYK70961.1 putative protein c21orf59 [Toxoplasma gondii TgCatPRC2]
MVLIHVKTSDEKNQFLYETQTSVRIGHLQEELIELHNLRLKTIYLSDACKGLSAHGPLRPEETRGLTAEVAKLSDLDIHAYGEPTNPDPTGYRTGVQPPPEAAEILEETAGRSAENVSHEKVQAKQPLTMKSVRSAFENLRGAVMIAYPAFHDLPEWDPARILLEEEEQQKDTGIIAETFDKNKTSLWWAGKELQNDKELCHYIGRNEKTKIIARLQSKASGPPIREPRLDAETHKAMLSYCYKKRREEQELEEDEDDSYLDSEWANPRGLKNALIGGGREIRWKP